jgi:hypothetical protein
MAELLEGNRAELTQMRARVIALSPKATLRRIATTYTCRSMP